MTEIVELEPVEPMQPGVALSSLTTLGVGGECAAFAEPMNDDEVAETILAARERNLPLFIVGGGSNTLAADHDKHGVVLRSADYTMQVEPVEDDGVLVRAGAGVEWDELVAFTVNEGWAGLECLSGIPGRVGAAPIQNIGAYGQEVSETILGVEAMDRRNQQLVALSAEELKFAYRHSRLKGEWRDRYVVLRVMFRLRADGVPTLKYEELKREANARAGGKPPTLLQVRETVLRVRKRKSMVWSEKDPNRRSAGSFFMNPVVDVATADAVSAAAEAAGHDVSRMPRHAAGEGTEKLSAAWLIERAGFARGFAFGRAGLSTKHCLAVVNRGGASARDLVALASIVRRAVREQFGVTLVPEPVFVGFDDTVDNLLR
ncbi:MAG: UDP-N-acetylmuramate dehydrogenase [Bradymonadia bacterium]|jgi:UDP-N-acetylmuramate dehydrogenase